MSSYVLEVPSYGSFGEVSRLDGVSFTLVRSIDVRPNSVSSRKKTVEEFHSGFSPSWVNLSSAQNLTP